MGLDMYAYSVSPLARKNDKPLELAYWRKHNALHSWMCDLYIQKGGDKEFNCEPVELTSEDLDRLEQDVKDRNLVPKSGFFWGSIDYTEEDWQACTRQDLAFIYKAREAINNGERVYYHAWY